MHDIVEGQHSGVLRHDGGQYESRSPRNGVEHLL